MRSRDGFTLVELLVVVAIIGILASIAFSQFAVYKQQAVDADMQSALHSGRQAIEGYYVDAHTYVGADPAPGGNLQNTYGYRQTANITLSIASNPPVSVNRYGLCVTAPGGTTPFFFFDSAAGVMQRVASCP